MARECVSFRWVVNLCEKFHLRHVFYNDPQSLPIILSVNWPLIKAESSVRIIHKEPTLKLRLSFPHFLKPLKLLQVLDISNVVWLCQYCKLFFDEIIEFWILANNFLAIGLYFIHRPIWIHLIQVLIVNSLHVPKILSCWKVNLIWLLDRCSKLVTLKNWHVWIRKFWDKLMVLRVIQLSSNCGCLWITHVTKLSWKLHEDSLCWQPFFEHINFCSVHDPQLKFVSQRHSVEHFRTFSTFITSGIIWEQNNHALLSPKVGLKCFRLKFQVRNFWNIERFTH